MVSELCLIEDIEDVTALIQPKDARNRISQRSVAVKPKRTTALPSSSKTVAHEMMLDAADMVQDHSSFLPGKQAIFVKTWGCSHNNSDSEYMAGLLAAQGYRILFADAEMPSADLVLLNSCTVKNPSETTFVNAINKAKDLGKKVVVAGCVPQAQPGSGGWSELSAVGVQQIDRIVEVVEETLKGNTIQIFASSPSSHADRNAKNHKEVRGGGAPLDLPKIRKNPLVEIIPINTGCLNQCTYCKTKHARGDLGSYPPEEIYKRVRAVLDEGVTEIWLTSEDTGAYGRDIGVRIPELLWGIIKVLQEAYENEGKEVILRVGMTNPPYILDDLEEIAQILNHPRVFKFLHIPVQSGSDRVLNDMRRMYTCQDFRHIVTYLRDKVPDITIATDIICGFPGEDDYDHQQTMKLIQDLQFPVLHISQFYPRPGTPAARMERIPTQIVKSRSREVTKLFESYTCYEKYVGTIQRVWITEQVDDSERLGDCWVAHDIYYHQVLIPKNRILNGDDKNMLGHCCDVKIVDSGKFYVVGELTDASRPANPVPVTSTVMLQRTGRNNRKVAAKTVDLPKAKPEKQILTDLEQDLLPGTVGIVFRLLIMLTLCGLLILSAPYAAQLIRQNLLQLDDLPEKIQILRSVVRRYSRELDQFLIRPASHLIIWLTSLIAAQKFIQ